MGKKLASKVEVSAGVAPKMKTVQQVKVARVGSGSRVVKYAQGGPKMASLQIILLSDDKDEEEIEVKGDRGYPLSLVIHAELAHLSA